MKIFKKVRLQRLNCVKRLLTHLVCCIKMKCVNTLSKNSINDALNCVKLYLNCVNKLKDVSVLKYTPPIYIGGVNTLHKSISQFSYGKEKIHLHAR